MNKFLSVLLLLITTALFAADHPVACSGASCKVIVETRNGSNVKVTAMSAAGTGEVSFPLGINRTDVAIFAYENGDQTLTETGLTTVNYTTEVHDVTNSFSSSTFTAPVSGFYRLSGCISLEKQSGTTVAGDQFLVGYRKNGGSNTTSTAGLMSAGIVGYVPLCLSEVLSLSASDTIIMRIQPNIGGSRTFSGRLTGSRISIERI